jgi:signal transduction histidine kinase
MILPYLTYTAATPADQSSRIEENRTIWQLTHELTQANDALQRLGHMVSHDLRGPLANMEGLVSLLDESNMGATPHKEVLGMLKNAFSDFRQQLDDLNELLKSRHTSGELWEEIDIKKEFHQVRQQLLGFLTKAQGEIETVFEIEQFCSVRLYVQSIVYNLVSNSIKYRDPDRQLKVIFSVKKDNNNIILSVEDNGSGIDLKANRDRLFKPYSRLQTEGEGHGLGLYLIKGQIEALGGWLEVASTLGKGSRFTVFLPQNCPF